LPPAFARYHYASGGGSEIHDLARIFGPSEEYALGTQKTIMGSRHAAIATGVTDRLWDVADLVAACEAEEQRQEREA
jgi:hypothetical protein